MRISDRELQDRRRRSPAVKRPGPDLRTRYDHAVALGRGYEAAGDEIEAQRCYQQAEHYCRLLNDRAA